MAMNGGNPIHRRGFLRRTGLAGAGLAAGPLVMGQAPRTRSVALVADRLDPVAESPPLQRALAELKQALSAAGYRVLRRERIEQAGKGELCIVAADGTSQATPGFLAAAGLSRPPVADSFALFETAIAGRRAIVALGADARGLTYALFDLTDRVLMQSPLEIEEPVLKRRSNQVRSVMRQFVSETLDKPWFYDRTMWPRYLSMLATQRFNRFHLAFGLGYDALKNVEDSYLLFLYPFLLAVPGYDVRATSLADAERDRNLATLRFICEETVACGLDFQLGVWMHGYQLIDSPRAKYLIEGLTAENHALYCRDALTATLKALPAVSSVALRIHGESGVAEGSYDFWKTVFDGVARCGRTVEIDLHAKGIDAKMIDIALATGMPVNVSPKFSAEHLGLPYHQADIRPSEIPTASQVGKGLMSLSEGQRSFTRYGYADLMRDDRRYSVRPRVFAGTQRILASGNAAAGTAYARAFQFCGMTGADLMEPLTCRGRRGSGIPGTRRSGYLSARMEPKYDWEKYEYWYRSFGRTMFDPDSDPGGFQMPLSKSARALQSALENASRILPLVTSAHSESAACDLYWPEIYWNMPLASEAPAVFFDAPSPKTFQNVTALDPQMFSSCSEFAGELLGARSGKYSPFEVALWLEKFAAAAEIGLKVAGKPKSVDALRTVIDAEIQVVLARFFAAKLRAGVFCAIHDRSGDRESLATGLTAYRTARAHWAKIIERTKGIYASDLSVSDRFTERGQWSNRLADIDADIAALEAKLASAAAGADSNLLKTMIEVVTARPPLTATHMPPAGFTPKQVVALEIAAARKLTSALLWYRHVNQAERWISTEMIADGGAYRAAIPAVYTDSPYPLQYYFEFRAAPEKAWLHPGFDADLLNQPYFVLRRD